MVRAEDIPDPVITHVIQQVCNPLLDGSPVARFQNALVETTDKHNPAFGLLRKVYRITARSPFHGVQGVKACFEYEIQRLLIISPCRMGF